jgi:hypothetical protein
MTQPEACVILFSILHRTFLSDVRRFPIIDHIRAASPSLSNQNSPLDFLSLFQLLERGESSMDQIDCPLTPQEHRAHLLERRDAASTFCFGI